MPQKNLRFICCFVVTLWLWGCADVPPTHYYTFRPDSAQQSAAVAPKYPEVLAIGPFEPDAPYQQTKIVYRTSPYEVNFYEYQQWLRPLPELVTEQAVKLASASGLFQKVVLQTAESSADYLLRIRIKMFDLWYQEHASLVRIQLEYALLASKAEQVIWREVVETTAPVPNVQIVVETVKGFETALQENLRQALTAIEQVLAQRK